MGGRKACVTGGSGFIGSWLTKTLLRKGFIVHATLRDLGDQDKVGLLKSFPHADANLVLFQADIYNPNEFAMAIKGCEYVFHVATPMQHYPQSSLYKDEMEATVGGVRKIVESCVCSGTVECLVYTGSVTAASPRTEDGLGFNHLLNESCWSPLSLPFPRCTDKSLAYVRSKTLAEKELLRYNDGGKPRFVSLTCGLVGGDPLLPNFPSSCAALIAPLLHDPSSFDNMNLLQYLLGSIPLVHIVDVCEAHIYCAEHKSMRGRYMCGATSKSIREITEYLRAKYPQYPIHHELVEEAEGTDIVGHDFSKLMKMGFEYKASIESIIDKTVDSAKRLGVLTPT